MTKQFIKFPSIEQFRKVVGDVKHQAQFQGMDENGEPIMDRYATMPKVKFTGTVKLHGTNAGICFNETDGLWAQSRKNIITPEKDNAAFAFFAHNNEDFFVNEMRTFAKNANISLEDNTICVFGEWAGGNIQKGVALNGLDKFFAIFAIKIVPHNEEEPAFWVDFEDFEIDNERRVFNVRQFEVFEMEIDFENVAEFQNKLIELTLAVEEECPAGKFFGITKENSDNTVGEGIVWVGEYKGSRHVMKVKGEKHSASKVKTVKVVDTEKHAKALEFANEVCKSWRLEQAVQEVFDTINGGTPDIKGMGGVIQWVMRDILKEEADIMAERNLEPKQIQPHVAKIVVPWFKEQLDKEAFA